MFNINASRFEASSVSTLNIVSDLFYGPSNIRHEWKKAINLVDDISCCNETKKAAARMNIAILRVALAALTAFAAISLAPSAAAGAAIISCAAISLPAALPAVTILCVYKAVTLLTAYVATQSLSAFVAGGLWAAAGAFLITAGKAPKYGLGEAYLFPAASKFASTFTAKIFTLDMKKIELS